MPARIQTLGGAAQPPASARVSRAGATLAQSSPAASLARSTRRRSPFWALVRRDLTKFGRDRARWIGVAAQPLLFWLLIGTGLDQAFQIEGAGHLGYAHYFFPGVVALASLFTALFATMSLIEDRREGLLRSACVSPVSRFRIAVARVVSVTLLGLLQAAIVLAFSPWADYPPGDVDWLAVASVLTVGTAALASFGVALAWKLRSVHAYHALMSVVLIPLWILSGSMFPSDHGIPAWIIALDPLSYFVSGLRAALGSPLATATVGSSLSALAVLAAVALGALAWVTRSDSRGVMR